MSLKEQIRKILSEELSPRLRRRFSPDELENEFLESFESAYNLTKKRKVLSSHFLDELVNTTITIMMDGMDYKLHSTLPEYERWYDDVHQELENHYKNRIEKFYKVMEGIKESTPNIRKILREERAPMKILRRTHEIDREFKRLMSAVYRPNSICRYDDGSELFQVVTEGILENLYFNTFYQMDDTSNEWEKIANFISDYTWEKYGKEVLDYYHTNCNSQKMETNESELTEKCWPGYTQKGMKTMFGKRYPNCVKKTKK